MGGLFLLHDAGRLFILWVSYGMGRAAMRSGS